MYNSITYGPIRIKYPDMGNVAWAGGGLIKSVTQASFIMIHHIKFIAIENSFCLASLMFKQYYANVGY